MSKVVYEIDGRNSSTLEEFANDLTQQLNLQTNWRGNLDALNDILRGGFGTPDDGFVLVWKNSALSKQRLGYSETIKWLNEHIGKCHPSNVEHFRQRHVRADLWLEPGDANARGSRRAANTGGASGSPAPRGRCVEGIGHLEWNDSGWCSNSADRRSHCVRAIRGKVIVRER